MKEKLVILDYTTCTVHIYPLEREDPITDETLSNLGLSPDNCYYMTGKIDFIVHNKEVVR